MYIKGRDLFINYFYFYFFLSPCVFSFKPEPCNITSEFQCVYTCSLYPFLTLNRLTSFFCFGRRTLPAFYISTQAGFGVGSRRRCRRPDSVPEVTAPQLRCSRCSMQEPESNIRQHLDNESVRAEERVASQGLGDRGERRTTWGQTISRTHART